MKQEPNTVWRIVLDRYGDEQRAKSKNGIIYSVLETGEIIAQEYDNAKIKPEIEVVAVGMGMALADYLIAHEIPVTKLTPLLHRTGGADVYKSRITNK